MRKAERSRSEACFPSCKCYHFVPSIVNLSFLRNTSAWTSFSVSIWMRKATSPSSFCFISPSFMTMLWTSPSSLKYWTNRISPMWTWLRWLFVLLRTGRRWDRIGSVRSSGCRRLQQRLRNSLLSRQPNSLQKSLQKSLQRSLQRRSTRKSSWFSEYLDVC